MDIVNPVPADEAEGWLSNLVTTFLGAPWDETFPIHVERRRAVWLPERTWGARDHRRWVATLATDDRRLTIPGAGGETAELPADALTAVTVSATHRRRGLLTRMLTASLQQAVDRGDPVTILLAAEWPIYGRFGYAPATRYADYTLFTRQAGVEVAADPAGTLRQIDPVDLAEHAADIFARARRRWAGSIDRPGEWWSRRLGAHGFAQIPDGRGTWIVHESGGVPDGFLAWKAFRDFDLNGDFGGVEVLEFVAATDRAYRNLWSYLCSLDVISEVRLHQRPINEPIRWLLGDGRALRQQYTGDELWLRILDVPAALSARGYGADGRIVLDVVDDSVGGYAAGRYLLDAGPDGASCTRTTESADLTVSQHALASAYLGDHSVRELAIGGGVDERTTGALTLLDAMLATHVRPWNGTGF